MATHHMLQSIHGGFHTGSHSAGYMELFFVRANKTVPPNSDPAAKSQLGTISSDLSESKVVPGHNKIRGSLLELYQR